MKNRQGLSLVEILVALSLLSLVFLIAGLVLTSGRNVTEEVLREPPRMVDRALERMGEELFTLTAPMGTDEEPALRLEPDGTLSWLRLSWDEAGREKAEKLQYELEEVERVLQRISEPPEGVDRPPVTNVVATAVSGYRVEALDGERWVDFWPPEDAHTAPPKLLRIRLDRGRGEEGRTREWLIPAGLRARPEEGL